MRLVLPKQRYVTSSQCFLCYPPVTIHVNYRYREQIETFPQKRKAPYYSYTHCFPAHTAAKAEICFFPPKKLDLAFYNLFFNMSH